MSLSTDILGIADADLVTSGGRGHLVQYDGASTERIDLVTTSRSATIVGALTNNDPDAAGEYILVSSRPYDLFLDRHDLVRLGPKEAFRVVVEIVVQYALAQPLQSLRRL